MTNEILKVENLSFNYRGGTQVLRDVSFSINGGDFLGIIGSNGAGKSTLLKLILGLLTADTGKIYVDGADIKKSRPEIGYVSQKAIAFNSGFPATVSEVVMSGLKKPIFSRRTHEDRERLDGTLSRVGMSEYRDKLIGRLSGGQQQRVFIARALMSDNRMLILDEPTAGIDAVSAKSIMELISELNKSGITVIMTNHDTPALAEAANKLLVFCEHGNGELLNRAELSEHELWEIYAGKRRHHHA